MSLHEKLVREAREARASGAEDAARIDRYGNLTYPEPVGRAASSPRVRFCPECGAQHMHDQIGSIIYCCECDPDGSKDRKAAA